MEGFTVRTAALLDVKYFISFGTKYSEDDALGIQPGSISSARCGFSANEREARARMMMSGFIDFPLMSVLIK